MTSAQPVLRDEEQRPRRSIWSRRFVLITLIGLIANLAQYMSIALVPVASAKLGGNAFMVGVVTGAFAITALGSRFFVGVVTGRFPKRALLFATLLLITVAFAMYAAAPDLGVLLAGRLVHGIGMGFLAPLTLALAADALPEDRMASGIGWFSMSQAFSMAAGPAIGLALLGATSIRIPFLICLVTTAAAALMAWGLPRQHDFAPERVRLRAESFFAREALRPAVIVFFLATGFASVNAFVVLFGREHDIASVGTYFTVYAATMLAARPITGRLADRYGVRAVMVPSMVLFLMSFVVLALSHGLPMMLAAAVLAGLGYGVCQPLVQSLALGSVAPERRAVAGSTNYFGVDLAYLITPVAAGGLLTAATGAFGSTGAGYTAMFLVMTLPVAVAIALALRTRRTPRPQENSL